MILPNNVADLNDMNFTGNSPPFNVYPRNLPAVPGRWGEASGIQINSLMPSANSAAFAGLTYPPMIYNNPVRAGRSVYIAGTTDIMDDDFDGIDPVLASYLAATLYYNEPSNPVSMPINVVARILPEQDRHLRLGGPAGCGVRAHPPVRHPDRPGRRRPGRQPHEPTQ